MKRSMQKWEQSILPYISLGRNAVFSNIRSAFCSLSLPGKQVWSTLKARHVGMFASLSCCNWLIIEAQIVSKILSAPLAWIPPKCFSVTFSSLTWLVLLALLSALSLHLKLCIRTQWFHLNQTPPLPDLPSPSGGWDMEWDLTAPGASIRRSRLSRLRCCESKLLLAQTQPCRMSF